MEQDTFNDLFLFSLDETGKWWNHFTCQSPAFPEVEDYNELRDCIWAGTCEFTDTTDWNWRQIRLRHPTRCCNALRGSIG